MEDALEMKDQPNVPGTADEHPNWRRRLPVPLEDLPKQETLQALARALTKAGRNFGPAHRG
jgi:4-alpha-glucanotransferase